MVSPSKPIRDCELPDDELLGIAQAAGDPDRRRAAATELITRYRDAVYLWCFRYTRDRERALDLSQDVLASVWQRMGSFEGRARFSSWLFTVTRNRCIDASRRVGVFESDADLETVEDPAPRADADPEEARSEGWLLRIIRNDLAPDEQQAIWLRCVERMSVDEVTRILRLDSASGARAVLQRARRKILAAMERERRKP
jgi:RNA polymerase sigma-70 factor, ECF subfamily